MSGRITISRAILLLAGLLLTLPAPADDKDLLKKPAVAPNVMLIFGNSDNTARPYAAAGGSMWDGDADSPGSKLGAAKRVVKRFVQQHGASLNIGLTSFDHNPNAGSIDVYRKHWLYAPLAVDFPNDVFKEPIGTIERWGTNGEGPCTDLVSPPCTTANGKQMIVTTNGNVGVSVVGPFFGPNRTNEAVINLGTKGNGANAVQQRIRVRLEPGDGNYGDAFTDGSLAALVRCNGACAVRIHKIYEEKGKNDAAFHAPSENRTPGGTASDVTVPYGPAPTLTADLFYTSGDDEGKEIGFLRKIPGQSGGDFDVSANCAGWEFQSNNAPLPLVKIPRDYTWGPSCTRPPQASLPCVSRLLRPQAVIAGYGTGSGWDGTQWTYDHDNKGYNVPNASGGQYDDGCDPSVMGAVDAGLDIAQNQVILTNGNANQVPLNNLLQNTLDYFTNPAIDGFSGGHRQDDPHWKCRTSSVILIYDTFNGCQNDNCSYLTNHTLAPLKAAGIQVWVIGFGVTDNTSGTGKCIANGTGAQINGVVDSGYFPVNSTTGLETALNIIASQLNENTADFASASISSVQAGTDQMAYLATFNASKSRSIWNGRLNGYKLNVDGTIPTATYSMPDPFNATAPKIPIQVPSNDPSVLKWNAGMNLAFTPGTGATNGGAVLQPGGALATSNTYLDVSTDTPTTIGVKNYSGRKIVWSLPQSFSPSPPTTLPIANTPYLPEQRFDLLASTGASFWTTLKALLAPQASPPTASTLTDTDATNSLRFIWGDRDAVLPPGLDSAHLYCGPNPGDPCLKLGDIFHSNPALVGPPNNYFYYASNLNGYSDFVARYKHRRRVLYAGANDGLLHAFDIGAFNRTPSVCQPLSDGSNPGCYDLGTGAELFAFAPRSIMPIFKTLKDAAGGQQKNDEWTVDLAPTALDVYIDGNHSGVPNPSSRSWQSVVIGGMREGSPFEGQSGRTPKFSYGSYYALNVTQPDEIVSTTDPTGVTTTTIAPGTFNAPECLNQAGDSSCARSWPTVLWEITDTTQTNAGYSDMGETWSKPGAGRIRLCTSGCGTSSATWVDKFVAVFGGGFDRTRANRQGNWLYVVDIETGTALLKVNAGCKMSGSGCTLVPFASMPSEPSVLDFNGDGYLDDIYIPDAKGQMWRVDLTDLRLLPSVTGRWTNKIDQTTGSGRPFLLFQPELTVVNQVYMGFYRPSVIFLSDNTTGLPTVGVAYGTGDRDDILASIDPISMTYPQRYYYVIDDRSNVTRTEGDLYVISSPTAPNTATVPPKGWLLKFRNGERLITDSLTVEGVIHFGTYLPEQGNLAATCGGVSGCGQSAGTAYPYAVDYATGNAIGDTRSGTGIVGGFLTSPVGYSSGDNSFNVVFTTNNNQWLATPVPKRTSTTVKEWKER